MQKNYHTHSVLCHHAFGTVDEYVKRAIKGGLEVLGFSDHGPYPFQDGHQSKFRMTLEETATYVQWIQDARAKYDGQIRLYIGFETEYYPHNFDNMIRHVTKYPVDYLILGQHFTKDETDGVSAHAKTDNEEVIKDYVDQVIAGMETDVITYVAHPDMVQYVGSERIYERECTRLIRRAAELGVPLEFNLLGFRERRNYPDDRFWQMVAAEGSRVKVVLGSDAHRPQHVVDKRTINRAVKKLAGLGITPTEDIELRPVVRR